MRINTLALNMGRKLQKKQTGFVHCCKESEDFVTHDTIPSLENALFALSLFRSRLADNVLEGKALIEKTGKTLSGKGDITEEEAVNGIVSLVKCHRKFKNTND